MTESQKQKVIVVLGPTASGKSNLGIKLARKFNGEIISADSRQIYRGMDIGTGKVTLREQRLTKHHLLDVANPKKVFTVSDFKKLGEKAVKEILNKNKIPLIVGGTGFYIDTLIYDLNFPQVPPNKLLRLNLKRLTAEQLFHKLKKLDPQRAKTIDRYNKVRLIRALEIIDSMGKVPALNTKYELLDTKYDVLWLGLKPKNLEKRIKIRLEKRLKQGLVKEVKKLLARGISKKRLRDLGLEYGWLSRYINKEINYKDMKEGLLIDISKYSKRQMTWFGRNKKIHWIKSQRETEKLIRDFVRSPQEV